MVTTYLVYLLVASYFAIERSLRKGQQALSLQYEAYMQRTWKLLPPIY